MTDAERISYYQAYIDKLKKEDEIRAKQQAKLAKEQEAMAANGGGIEGNDMLEAKKNGEMLAKNSKQASILAPKNEGNPRLSGQGGLFYFYNPSTLAYGKAEFKKNWGSRAHKENWRTVISKSSDAKNTDDNADVADENSDEKDKVDDVRYNTDFYISQLPTTQKEADSLAKERNFAYYQLGVIYKEKFKEYKRAADKLEKLLESQPEERLVLPSMYHLYKIYEIIDQDKAVAMKGRIIGQYPDSRYAQILSNSNSESLASLSPEVAYNNLFKRYQEGDYRNALAEVELAVDQYTGDETVSKFELLKARIIGKLRGIDEYKKALNFVALNYPNSAEGKEAEALLGTDVPALAKLEFSGSETTSWKILYLAKDPAEKNTKNLVDKVKKFLTDRNWKSLKMSFDVYTEEYNFVVIHGMVSEENAKSIATILKDFKEYKVPDVPIIISGQNYEIVQMKKNIGDYLANPVLNPKSVTDQLPSKARIAAAPTNAPPAKRADREEKTETTSPKSVSPITPPGANQNPRGQKVEEKSRNSQPPSLTNPPMDAAPKK